MASINIVDGVVRILDDDGNALSMVDTGRPNRIDSLPVKDISAEQALGLILETLQNIELMLYAALKE